jgi:hypothetical protein
MSWASGQDVAVMNLSLGGPGSPRSPLAREVDALVADGIIVCVAAGNAGPDRGTISSPGDARGALTVGAADKAGALAFYSSRGPVVGVRYRKPDVVAIGGGVTRGAACGYGAGIASARSGARRGSVRHSASLRADERDVDGHAARRGDLRAARRGAFGPADDRRGARSARSGGDHRLRTTPRGRHARRRRRRSGRCGRGAC